MLADRDLRRHIKPLDIHTQDWAHEFLNNGVGGVNLILLVRSVKPFGVDRQKISDYCDSDWLFPGSFKTKVGKRSEIFNERRAESCQLSWKSCASDFLMVHPVVLHFAQTVLRDIDGLAAEIESVEKLQS